MTAVVRAMANPESGLEVRDRMWLKITIRSAFIGESSLTLILKSNPFDRSTGTLSGGATRRKELLSNGIPSSGVRGHFWEQVLSDLQALIVW